MGSLARIRLVHLLRSSFSYFLFWKILSLALMIGVTGYEFARRHDAVMRRQWSLAKWLFNHGLLRWRKFKPFLWFYFVTCSTHYNLFWYHCRIYFPPTPQGTIQVVSLKKMYIRLTRTLEITDSRRESWTTCCCLAIVEPKSGGQ